MATFLPLPLVDMTGSGTHLSPVGLELGLVLYGDQLVVLVEVDQGPSYDDRKQHQAYL